MNYQAFKMCLVYDDIDSADTFKRFRGVVGYHIRLTRGRSPVRTRTKTVSFHFSKENIKARYFYVFYLGKHFGPNYFCPVVIFAHLIFIIFNRMSDFYFNRSSDNSEI